MDPLKRYRGRLLGLATGDDLGMTLEFCQPGGFEPIPDIVCSGHFNLKPGESADDTSMAMCLAESQIKGEKFDPVDQLQRYVRWWRKKHLSGAGALFELLDCEAAITIAGSSHKVKSGEMIEMPADKSHTRGAKRRFKTQVVMIRS
jgi:ADP-ribosylglycohydrolase